MVNCIRRPETDVQGGSDMAGRVPVLISACLLGIQCRYDGGGQRLDGLERLMARAELIPVCPEQLGGLEVAGADGVFHPVDVARMERGRLVVRSGAVREPRTVRYGWGDFKPGNLHAVSGLPLTPFELTVE